MTRCDELAGRHVAITGAAGGIGSALARTFAVAGASVTLVGRRREPLTRLAAELQVRSCILEVDLLRDPSGWVREAEAELGPIDVLINNAGELVAGPFAEIDPRRERDIIELDLAVPLALMRAVLPHMLRRRAGTVVNIASTGALAPNPGMVSYCAAKAGVRFHEHSPLRGPLFHHLSPSGG
jgi:short-subunit dehydrogenase